jgi:DNA-binding LacI/PurR family transcriptional regulator
MTTTIKDVARLAGVSAGTVSSVLNDKPGVSEKSMNAVRRAIVALNYHPNHIARSLRVRKTNTLGMILPQINTMFFGQVVRGAVDEAGREGYSILICDTNYEPAQEQRHLSALYSRRVDGILLASAQSYFHRFESPERDVPIVFFDDIPDGHCGPAVTTANAEAAQEATEHLISLGHFRIAMISGPTSLSTGLERAEGFRRAMGAAGLPVKEEFFVCGNFRLEEAHICAMNLLSLPVPPTAIIAASEEMTIGLLQAVAEMGIRCPEQVSIVGFDDFVAGPTGFSLAMMFEPKLTAVAQSSYEMGKVAVRTLLQIIRNVEGEPKQDEKVIRLPARLEVRGSTASPCEKTLPAINRLSPG